jgi:hypothetical protein
MKNVIRIMMITTIATLASLAVAGQQDKKAAAARKDASKAKSELRQAKIDSAADYLEFKKEAELKISENEKEIKALKAEKDRDTKEIRTKFDNEVGGLEEKNNALKSKIASADITETSKWTSFKQDFNREMDDLGQSIKELTTRDKNE